MESEKTLGTDGLPADFYKVLWNDISTSLICALNYAYKTGLLSITNYDQTGFLKGRFIGENIRLIDSVICYAKEKNIPELLLFLDFGKAFDTLEWAFIRKTFNYFGFCSSILKLLNLFYCRPQSCVLSNGWGSNFFLKFKEV